AAGAMGAARSAPATLLSVQRPRGLAANHPAIALTDSLVPPALPPTEDGEATEGRALLPVAAAEASLSAAERSLAFTRRSRFAPTLELGFDTGDPSSPTPPPLLPALG